MLKGNSGTAVREDQSDEKFNILVWILHTCYRQLEYGAGHALTPRLKAADQSTIKVGPFDLIKLVGEICTR